MKHNKNADTLLFLLSFTKNQREKILKRTFLVSAGGRIGWETAGCGNTLPQYLPNPTSSRIYIYIKYSCLTLNWQKS